MRVVRGMVILWVRQRSGAGSIHRGHIRGKDGGETAGRGHG
jgi:hypothetical protein